MLVPMVFIDFLSHMTVRWLSYNRLSLLAIANSKEIRMREHQDNRGLHSDLALDLDTATRKLTFLTDEFAITESISKTQLRFIDLIEEMLQENLKHSTTTDDVSTIERTRNFLDEAYYLRQSFNSALQCIERDKQGIQGLVQTVRFHYCVLGARQLC
jgi:hypothetical protein